MSKTLLLLKNIADLELLQINTCSRALVFLRRSCRTFLTSSRLCSTFDCATWSRYLFTWSILKLENSIINYVSFERNVALFNFLPKRARKHYEKQTYLRTDLITNSYPVSRGSLIFHCRVVKNILSSRRIREGSRHVFPGGAGRGRHITIDMNSSNQVSSSCQTW